MKKILRMGKYGPVFHARARARHETLNRRFKQFSVIGKRFRHELSLHSTLPYRLLVRHLSEIGIAKTMELLLIILLRT